MVKSIVQTNFLVRTIFISFGKNKIWGKNFVMKDFWIKKMFAKKSLLNIFFGQKKLG